MKVDLFLGATNMLHNKTENLLTPHSMFNKLETTATQQNNQEIKETKSSSTSDSNIINIVFDLDDTIVTGFDEEGEALEKKHPWINLFKKNNLYLEAIKPHIIHPGVIELLQLLDTIPNVKISFFSSGIKERNEILVEKLLCQSLGKTRYESIKNQIIICSKDKLTALKNGREQYDNYGIYKGNYKKDLTHISNQQGTLDRTILIDDDTSYCYYGQEKNVLNTLYADDLTFSHIYASRKNRPLDIEEHNHCANHVYYITGLLITLFEIVKNDKTKTLRDVLFEIQYKKNDNPSIFKPRMEFNNKLFENENYYQLGLKELQKINPDLRLFSPDYFLGETFKVSGQHRLCGKRKHPTADSDDTSAPPSKKQKTDEPCSTPLGLKL